MSSNYNNFFPRKVYRCPCLMHVINQIHDVDIRCYSQILQEIFNRCQGRQV